MSIADKLIRAKTDYDEVYEAGKQEEIKISAKLIGGTITEYRNEAVTTVRAYAFYNCPQLRLLDLPSATTIANGGIRTCQQLRAVILRSDQVCTSGGTQTFLGCCHITGEVNSTFNPNGDKDGYIYVPSALVDEYKTATNWVTYADQIRAIEGYPEIAGG